MATAWLAVAAAVGVLVGRMIRERDRQVPPAPGAAPMRDTEDETPRRVPGKGQQRPPED